jgi:hypothetical protein
MDDLDNPRESPEHRARRMWENHALTKKFLEEKKAIESAPPPTDTEPKIGDVITNEHRTSERVAKFERQFLKDIRAMLNEHTERNLALYRQSLIAKRRYYLRLKIRYLERLIAEKEKANDEKQAASGKKDLFA